MLFLVLPAALCAQAPQTKSTATLTHKIIDNGNGSFGYDIYSNGKLLVRQPTIPAVSGNAGFKTKADAERTAVFVEGKIRKGEMPPTVTVEELKKLKVI